MSIAESSPASWRSRRVRPPLGAGALVLALLPSTLASAQTDEDLASLDPDLAVTGTASDRLGGLFVADVYNFYWDTPSDGDSNTGRGPATAHGTVSCDFDGDGALDLAVAAPGHGGGAGAVYLLYGRTRSLLQGSVDLGAGTFDVRLDGPSGSDFGADLGAADVNGDGYCDLLVGAPERSDKGSVFLFLGGLRETGTAFAPGPGAAVSADAVYALRVSGGGDRDAIAFTIATGDVSGDGVDDFAVGAMFMDRSGERDAGAIALYFGKLTATRANTSGLQLSMDTATGDGPTFDGYNVRYFGADGYPSGLFAFEGPADNAGTAIAIADLDGDGVDDLAMGAPCPELNYSAAGSNDTGSVYLVFGGGPATGSGTERLGSGAVLLSDPGTYHLRFNGVQDWAHLGAALAAGELTGDGVLDLLVAAPYGWHGFSAGDESGSVYLIPGQAAWQQLDRSNAQVDLNGPGDGFSWRFDGAAAGDELRAVATADVDGDGADDLLLGAPRADPVGRADAGVIYTLLGPLAGSGALDLGAPGQTVLLQTVGASAGDLLGLSVGGTSFPCGAPRRLGAAPGTAAGAGSLALLPPLGAYAPSALVKVSGDGQSAQAGAPLPDPVEVRVEDGGGAPLGCVEVTFTAQDGGAAGAGAVRTGLDGLAQTSWTLGPTAGSQTLTASVAGINTPATFTASATPLCTPVGPDDDCDGEDEDCDGTADDAYVGHPTSCGVGACAAAGAMACVGGVEQDSCTPGSPAPSDATCDGVDDDCDGTTDEDYSGQPTSCGVGACAATGAVSCVAGVESDSCAPGAPAPADTTCDDVDDDCDGAADEDYATRATTCGVGACAASGTTSCAGGVEADSCTPGAAAAGDATCDGVDDDCDGTADEDALLGAACAGSGDPCEVGVCNPVAGGCETSRRSGCCSADSDCPTAGPCLQPSCDVERHACVYWSIAGCCGGDADCDDADPCTIDRCDLASGACRREAIYACCEANADCDDGDPCTYDACSDVGRCLYLPLGCSEGDPCAGTPGCVFSGVRVRRGASSPVSAEVRRGHPAPIMQLRFTTAAIGGSLQSLRLRLAGFDDVDLGAQRVDLLLYPDADADGAIDPGSTSLALAGRVDLRLGEVDFADIQLLLAPATDTHALLVAQVSGASVVGCAALEGGRAGSVLALLVLVLCSLPRGRRSGQGRRARLRVLVAAALLAAALAVCARTGFAELHTGTIRVDSDQAVEVIAGPLERMAVEGSPVESEPFELWL